MATADTYTAERDRLPTLFEVLSRRTLPPVDLFSFYIYMRDQQHSVDYLDFWLDVSQHMSLCRHYVRELRRSVMIETPELDKGGSKRSSAVLESLGDVGAQPGPSTAAEQRSHDARLSAFLRSESGSKHSPSGSQGSQQTTPNEHDPPRPSFMTNNSNSPGAASNSPMHTVARVDIRSSAEKILYTYLLAGAEREIILPQGILNDIIHSIEEEGRDDPEVFDAAKDYVFQAMERDAFPGFLNAKALGNIIPPSMMLRLIFGVLALFGGVWTAFILIFLDYDRRQRCWEILPFSVGTYLVFTHQWMLDPLMALAGTSEYTLFQFSRVREPYVHRYLRKRALLLLGWIVLTTAALCVLFIFVPGKRL